MISTNAGMATSKAWRQSANVVSAWQTKTLLNRTDKIVIWSNGQWTAIVGDAIQWLSANCRAMLPTVVHPYSIDGRCKWVCLDFDNHDSRGEIAQRNFDTATAILNTLLELGVVALLEDSDGQGGLHLWILFSPTIAVDDAYRFARWISSDYRDDKQNGFDIEKNPKRRNASGDSNGVRVPGCHHKRNHVSRFWGDGWVEGAEAIQLMLNTPRNNPAVLDLMGDYDPDFKERPKPGGRLTQRPYRASSGSGATFVEQAEQHLQQAYTWPELLTTFGWHGGPDHWTRPGKDSGTSGTLNFGGNGLLHVFTNAAGLPDNQSYGKWRFWLHSMGFSDAHQSAAAQRYLQEVSQ